jgi:hypothetical protein
MRRRSEVPKTAPVKTNYKGRIRDFIHTAITKKKIQWQQQARQHNLLHPGCLLLLQLFIHFHTNSRLFVKGPLGANHNRATFATTVSVTGTGQQTAHEETTKKGNEKYTSYSGSSTLAGQVFFFRKMIQKY